MRQVDVVAVRADRGDAAPQVVAPARGERRGQAAGPPRRDVGAPSTVGRDAAGHACVVGRGERPARAGRAASRRAAASASPAADELGVPHVEGGLDLGASSRPPDCLSSALRWRRTLSTSLRSASLRGCSATSMSSRKRAPLAGPALDQHQVVGGEHA